MLNFEETYITVKGWMSSVLKLRGNELLAFALVYGFSQDGQSEARSSISYIQKWLNCSRPTAISTINGLCKKEYIVKRQDGKSGKKRNYYRANLELISDQLKNFTSKETLLVASKETLPVASKETLPSIYTSNNNKVIIEGEKEFSSAPKPKKKAVRFVPPTLEELTSTFKEKLREKKVLGVDTIAEREANKFFNHYESNGWKVGKNKMKSWPHAVGGWLARMSQYETVSKTNKIDPNEGIISTDDAHAIINEIAANGW